MTDTVKRTIVHNENVHRPDPQSIDSPLEGAKAAVQGQEDPVEVGSAWCKKMQAAFDAQDADKIVAQFQGEKAFWRDILNIDISDFNTLRTNQIKDHLSRFGIPKITNLHVVQPHDAAVVPDQWIQCYLEAETYKTRIEGFVRLKESAPGRGDWKAFTFYTALKEVKGHEEFAGHRRPLGAEHGEHSSTKNWLEKLEERKEFKDEDPTVLIVGGGQNGLMLAARLTVLGIPNLIVEKNIRIGDSWRNRYHSLCLHDPIWADHFPYISYPPSFPIYLPKDKLANWMESYASAMELAVWLESTIERNPKFDETTKKWTVEVNRKGEKRTMHVNHLVLATGFSGEPRWPSFPREEFKGTLCHSSGHKGGQGWEGKKAVVVGCCNSGHDIAQDFAERGADVTIVQRSSTYVMSSKHGIPGLLNGVYEEGGPDLPLADLMLLSLPVDLLAEFHISATKDIAEKDKDLLDGLTKAGFKLNHYPAGLFIKYFRDGGGYYIDVGASGMIANGKIKIKQGVEVDRLTKDGIRFADGTELAADIVVCATGYTSQRETIRRVISDEVADGVGQVWGEDSQGEIPGVWRHSGVPRFYLQSGNMFQARCYSRHLAQRILLSELDMMDDTNAFPSYKHLGDPRF